MQLRRDGRFRSLGPAVAVIATSALTLLGLVASPGSANAKVPGPNGQIVFGRFDPAVGDQVPYTVNPDGSHLQQSSEGAADVPRWSPDGTKIAVLCCGVPTILDADGSGFTQLPIPSGFDPGAIFGCNVWSPDGSRLACEVLDDQHPERNGVYTMRSSDGGDFVRVTKAPSGDDIPCDYSPNGNWIVFERSRGGPNAALFLAHPDGTGERRLTSWGMAGGLASWSPNGKLILFDASGRIFVIQPDGSGLRQIPLDVAGGQYFAKYPVWSPNGKMIALTLFFPSSGIYTMRADGTHLTQITSALPGAGDVNEGDEYPDWGPRPLAT
jgi:Tol biopolymer transport system component